MPAFPQSHLAVDDSQLPPGRRATRHLLPCVGSALLLACPLLPGGEGFVLFEKAMNERQTGAVWVRSIQVECWSGGNRAGQSRVCLQPAASEAFVLDIILIVECPPPPPAPFLPGDSSPWYSHAAGYQMPGKPWTVSVRATARPWFPFPEEALSSQSALSSALGTQAMASTASSHPRMTRGK